jgi:hypothetical protein
MDNPRMHVETGEWSIPVCIWRFMHLRMLVPLCVHGLPNPYVYGDTFNNPHMDMGIVQSLFAYAYRKRPTVVKNSYCDPRMHMVVGTLDGHRK